MNYQHIVILLSLVISGCQSIKNTGENDNVSAFEDEEDEFETLNTKTDRSNLKYRRELSLAIVNNDLEKIKFYLGEGANPNNTLSHVVENRNFRIVQTLLENGADPNILRHQTSDVPSLLMRASNFISIYKGGRHAPSPDMVNLLMKYGADIHYENIYGNVISYIVCEKDIYLSAQDEDKLAKHNMIKFFINNGVSVNAYCKNGATPLANLYEFKYPSKFDNVYAGQKERREEDIKNSDVIMARMRKSNPIIGLIENAGGIEEGNPKGSWIERNILFPLIAPLFSH